MTPLRMADIHAAAFAGGETWDAATIRSLMERPGTRAVTHANDGFALLQILPPEADLLTIAVCPASQGAGIGRALLLRACKAAAVEGCHVLQLEVAADNSAAIALYEAAGFAATGRRNGYYARIHTAPVDAVIMSISLHAQQSGNASRS